LTPIQVTAPPGLPDIVTEARIFFGTLEHKRAYNLTNPPETTLAKAVQELGMDQFWEVDRSFNGTNKAHPTIIATRNEPKPLRQALPETIDSFIADHVEKGRRIASHKIKCKGNESPEFQAELISKAFSKPMEISEWVQESDGQIHIQCKRLEFTDIRFRLKGKSIDSRMQTSATVKQKENLASVLF
jgi:hypothetical protein